MHFQDIIFTLERYWADQGCVVLQPHDAMMGAGTFHPATVLRSLGDKPWRCAFVQPSRRPGDARYGENPNRLGHYYQYQVVLKPSPRSSQDLYLGSLQALGIDLSTNDVRFVEDDWESPTLGAWGLGWEIWLNGLEVTQYTYFQQVGGISCEVVPVELTYGLERLAMALQGVDNVYDLTWNADTTYRDVFFRNEVEQSKLNFEHSDPELLLEEFNANFAETRRLAGLSLALPAYDRCIATSHLFNMLDARGAISVAERAQYIRRIRELACECAEVWTQGLPAVSAPTLSAPVAPAVKHPASSGRHELFVGIECEELPYHVVRSALADLKKGVVGLLDGLPHGEVSGWATPRRLAVAVDAVPTASERVVTTVTGPPEERAFQDGAPTRAALGFAKGRGVAPEDLYVVDGPKGRVVAADVEVGGDRLVDRLAQGLAGVVGGISFPKTMRWGNGHMAPWARPLHRIQVTFAGQSVDLPDILGCPVEARATGHRLAAEREFAFSDAAGWLDGCRDGHVEPGVAERQQKIADLLVEAAKQLGCDPIDDPALLEEVLNLVEAPTLVIGQFDASLLALPSRLLVESMRKNQRYFPVFRDGRLQNDFIVVSNNPFGNADVIAAGNAAVLKARFDDARFFLDEDRRESLDDHQRRLGGMRWIHGMSTMADKQLRVAEHASALAGLFGADSGQARVAGAHTKFDLVTRMVGEFPDLQGHMGRLYAEHYGLTSDVAAAIEEAYMPLSASGDLPASTLGATVALAERLDTLVGCFGVGMKPKGGDPQGLRRAALGVVRIVLGFEIRVDLAELVADAVGRVHNAARDSDLSAWTKAQGSGAKASGHDALVADLLAFLLARYRAWAATDSITPDLVDAALGGGPIDVCVAQRKVIALSARAGQSEFRTMMSLFKRVLNITEGEHHPFPASADALPVPVERELWHAIQHTRQQVDAMQQGDSFAPVFDALLSLASPVEAFFDGVMVASDNPDERGRRMGLLLGAVDIFGDVADFSRISTR